MLCKAILLSLLSFQKRANMYQIIASQVDTIFPVSVLLSIVKTVKSTRLAKFSFMRVRKKKFIYRKRFDSIKLKVLISN